MAPDVPLDREEGAAGDVCQARKLRVRDESGRRALVGRWGHGQAGGDRALRCGGQVLPRRLVPSVPRGLRRGAEPRPKGGTRYSGAEAAPAASEEELEREAHRLEAQVAYLKIDGPEGGARLAARDRAAVVAALSGRFPWPTSWRRLRCQGRHATTRSRTPRLRPGSSCARGVDVH